MEPFNIRELVNVNENCGLYMELGADDYPGVIGALVCEYTPARSDDVEIPWVRFFAWPTADDSALDD